MGSGEAPSGRLVETWCEQRFFSLGSPGRGFQPRDRSRADDAEHRRTAARQRGGQLGRRLVVEASPGFARLEVDGHSGGGTVGGRPADGIGRRRPGDLFGLRDLLGWTYSSRSWERLWQAITGLQSDHSKAQQLAVPPTIGSGEDASVIVPVDDYRNLQIVNAHTGVVTTLGAEGCFKQPASLISLYPTADGPIVE